MNNQFATQFLLEDLEDVSHEELPFDIEGMVEKAMSFGLTRIEALAMVQEIIKNFKLDEDGAAAAPGGGGGSTTGGGSTAGASFTPGTGEQYASTKAFKGTRKKKYQEDAPRLAGDPSKTTSQGAKNLSAYSSVGFTKAPNAEEAGEKMKSIDVKMLWKEGNGEVEVSWSMIKDTVKMLGKRDLGIEPNSPTGQAFLKDVEEAFNEGLITSENDLIHFIHGYKETLRESRAYSQFKKQAATRSKDQQMHEAVKMIHNKLEEVSKLVEFAQQMRTELSEGENTLEYKHNTKKIFEKINSKVVEVYTKTRNLK